ncbi:MAG: methyltransferase family protein [bacterium]
MIERVGRLLFRLRSWTAVPLVLAFLVLARPRPTLIAAAIPVLLLGEALRIASLRYLGASARGMKLRADALATGGPYRYLRHPIYVGNALLVAGILLAGGAAHPVFVAVVACAVALQYGFIAASEDSFLAETFPEEFARYRLAVRRFVPLRAPYAWPSAARRSLGEVLRAEFRTLHTIALLLVFVVFKSVLAARA